MRLLAAPTSRNKEKTNARKRKWGAPELAHLFFYYLIVAIATRMAFFGKHLLLS